MPEGLKEAMQAARSRTLGLVAHLSDEEFERPAAAFFGPLVWDLGHIAAYEDLWLNHRLAGRPLRRPELAELYDAFETPRAVRGEATLLKGPALMDYLEAVRADSSTVALGDGALHELVLRHELQHNETMLQAMAVMGRLPETCGTPAARATPLELASVDGADVVIGAGDDCFAYDNERPQHVRRVDGFRIARRLSSNREWVAWADAGGYQSSHHWSGAGWQWRSENGIDDHAGARTGDPDTAVTHVSYFEAEAFAAASSARLPSEFEWESAAQANVLEGIGDAWEWTSSPFTGYPGFRAHPYREYSEVFFGDAYRVLRGWSCVTADRIRCTTFRNWDLPQRRHLFAGVRLAGDA